MREESVAGDDKIVEGFKATLLLEATRFIREESVEGYGKTVEEFKTT